MNRLRAPQGSIFIDFWEPLWHRFFNFFSNGENLKIDDPYSTLASFSFPEPLICRSIFHRFFMFFSEPLPESIFWRQKRRSKLKIVIFGSLWDPRGSQNPPTGLHFPQKRRRRPKVFPPEAILGPTLRPTTPKIIEKPPPITSLSIFEGFGMDFNWFWLIWVPFLKFF